MSLSLELLRIIGSPFAPETEAPIDGSEAPKLYALSARNRMPLFFLYALNRRGSLRKLEAAYYEADANYLRMYDAIRRASTALEDAGVNYTLFKTLRPYPATTVDIDSIILGSGRDYREAIAVMVDAGYRELGSGPWSTTVGDPLMDIGIDLYSEVAVSHVIYLDKASLETHVTRWELPGGGYVRTLSPAADLVTLLAHSVIKEHMYTLSEYYSFLIYLARMSSDEVSTFSQIIRDNSITKAASSHVTLSGALHEATHGEVPGKINQLLMELGEDHFEKRRLAAEQFKTPHKFHFLTIGKALLEKVSKNEKTKRSLVDQIVAMSRPDFAKDFLTKFIGQQIRETY